MVLACGSSLDTSEMLEAFCFLLTTPSTRDGEKGTDCAVTPILGWQTVQGKGLLQGLKATKRPPKQEDPKG